MPEFNEQPPDLPRMAIGGLETPCILIDRPRLLANLRNMRSIAERAGVALRPHIKTHKSLDLGRLQLADGGASGICASKPDEALVFIDAGFTDVTVAFPVVDPRKLGRLVVAANRTGATLNFITDCEASVAAVAAAAASAARPLGLFMKVDVGLHRVGVDPAGPMAVAIARSMAAADNVQFQGLLSHAGHAYAAASRDAVAEIAEAERQTLLALRDRLYDAGLEVPCISVGSTPSVLACRDFTGLTEIRPGNYVYLDRSALRLEVATPEEVALTVLATVVSCNDRYAIVDAGSKVLSSDKGAHSTGGDGYGIAFADRGAGAGGLLVEKVSEEHGWVAHEGCGLAVGDRLRIVPNHSCVVANLVGRAWVVEDGSVVDAWSMQAQSEVL